MNAQPRLGDVTREVVLSGGWLVRRRVAWVAYARNGNAHNPTVTHEWDVVSPDGRLFDCVTTLRQAKQIVSEMLQDVAEQAERAAGWDGSR